MTGPGLRTVPGQPVDASAAAAGSSVQEISCRLEPWPCQPAFTGHGACNAPSRCVAPRSLSPACLNALMLNQPSPQDPQRPLRAPAWASTSEAEERRLLSLVAERQMSAFDALYRCYQPRLVRFLDRMTRRPDMVEELLNDTLFVVWKRADAYNGRSKVSTWIFAIAYRKALKALAGLDDPVEEDEADARACEAPGPEQQLGQRQLHTELRRAMSKLSAEHRAVLELTYFHDSAYSEIAEIVDCPEATVKTRMFHARRRLRQLLDGALEDWL